MARQIRRVVVIAYASFRVLHPLSGVNRQRMTTGFGGASVAELSWRRSNSTKQPNRMTAN